MSAQVVRRGPHERALQRLEDLTREHGPREAARHWAQGLDPDEARTFAGAWALAAAWRYARSAEEARARYHDDGPS
jgi:hypothetical protein